MFMTRKITFIFKNKVADMVIILCVERLQAQRHIVNLIFSGFYPDMSMVGHLFRFGNIYFFSRSVYGPHQSRLIKANLL